VDVHHHAVSFRCGGGDHGGPKALEDGFLSEKIGWPQLQHYRAEKVLSFALDGYGLFLSRAGELLELGAEKAHRHIRHAAPSFNCEIEF
jgi:hypothetical protein